MKRTAPRKESVRKALLLPPDTDEVYLSLSLSSTKPCRRRSGGEWPVTSGYFRGWEIKYPYPVIWGHDAGSTKLWPIYSWSHPSDSRFVVYLTKKSYAWTLNVWTEARKWKVIALTNNFQKADVPRSEWDFLGWSDGATPAHLLQLFDDFCDSSTLGMR